MSSRERIHSLERRASQAPGLMRHGPLPILVSHSGPRPLDPSTSLELLEDKVRAQEAEIERLVGENRRLAATHGTLRQELLNTQQEAQRFKAHMKSIETESDIQIRLLLDKIAKFESEIRAGDDIKVDLQKARKEAHALAAARQDLIGQIQLANQELKKACLDAEKLPGLHAELDRLLEEHHRLRVMFEYEKRFNVEQVQQLQTMEQKLVSMAREVEMLRAEVINAEKKVHGGFTNHQHPSYPPHIPVSYHDRLGRPLVPAGPEPVAEGQIPYRVSSDGSAVWSGSSHDPSLPPK